MLELAKAERITLSEVEFSQYVLDEWGWRTAPPGARYLA